MTALSGSHDLMLSSSTDIVSLGGLTIDSAGDLKPCAL